MNHHQVPDFKKLRYTTQRSTQWERVTETKSDKSAFEEGPEMAVQQLEWGATSNS